MSENKLVWSDEHGDLRKKKADKSQSKSSSINESDIHLHLRRLTSGKGRTIIEIKGLPLNKKWCQQLAKELKKSLGVGGAYKNDFIEVHISEISKVTELLDKKLIKWKKTGG